MEKVTLKRDQDSVNDRKNAVIRLCDTPTGKSSTELAAELGYAYPNAIVPMLRGLIKKHRIYRDKFRYYKVQKAVTKPEPTLEPVIDKAISLGESIASHNNEDKFIGFVEDMAKDFIWQAEGVKVHQIKRFVDYIKAHKGGR